MTGTRIYRRQATEAIVGALPFIAFELNAVSSQIHLITGEPLIIKAGRNTLATHFATKSELWTGILGLGFFQLLSTCLILGWLNIRITVDEVGISATNLLRMEVFRAKWTEIRWVSRKMSYLDGTDVYRVFSDSGQMKFNGRLPYYDELASLIEERCHHVDFTSWQKST